VRCVELLNDLINPAPASRFSKIAETGIRVFRNTHAPLKRSGTLSTAVHWNNQVWQSERVLVW
jgi:hypothetical protein